jgi:DNA-binding SARP family transcriptional activator/predicted ATPase
MKQPLRFSLLGGINITLGGEPVTGFVSSKAQALLCYLAVSGRSHTREALAGMFWGNVPEADSRASLRQALSNLRKLIGAHLVITRQTAVFNQDSPHWLDVVAFEALLQDGRKADEAAINALQQAVSLYQGDFLAGFYIDDCPAFEEWLLNRQERLQQLALQAWQQLVTYHTRRGEYRQAIRYTRRWLAFAPWQETAHRQMMRLLAYTQQYNDALLQYDTCRAMVERELGVRPMPETTLLQQRIQTMRSTRRRLQLPLPPSPLVGRETELAELTTLLNDPDCRLLTILGLGGVGKTRLAMAVASQISPVFLEGVVFVSLADVTPLQPSPHHIVETLATAVAEALPVTLPGQGSLREQVVNYLRRREMLLVLDNFEHLLAGSDWLAAILRQAPELKFLVTSRERLNLRDEWLFDLGGLACPPHGTAAEVLPQYGAVRLFQNVISRYKRQRTLNGDSAAVIQICRLTAGLPLALELAAASTPDMPPAEIAAGIHRSLDFLHSKLRDLPTRHRSLRAVFDHSWRRLNQAERKGLQRLSVFHGSFTTEAARITTGSKPALLNSLAEKSLLQVAADNAYRLHEMIRQFAAEKLAAAPDHEYRVREGHADYYAGLLEVENERLLGARQAAALAGIEHQLPNIRTAWQWATQESKGPLLQKASCALTQFFFMRGRSPEGTALLQETVAHLEKTAVAQPVLGRLLAQQAWLQRGTHAYDETEGIARCSLALCRAAGDPYGEAVAVETMGWLVYYQGQYDQAIRLGKQALRLFQEAGEPYNLAYLLRMLGLYHLNQARYPAAGQPEPPPPKTVAALRRQAYTYFQEALPLAQAAGNRWSEARILSALGYHAYHSEQYDVSARYHRAALAIFRELDLPEQMATCLCWLGPSLSQLGQQEQARPYIYEALSIALTLGIPMSLIGALDQLVQSVLVKEEDAALAVELSALILSQPTTDERLRYRHEKLLTERKAALPEAVAAAAEQRGRHGRLEDVALQLLVDDDR